MNSQWKINNQPYFGNKFSHCFNSAGTFTISGTLNDNKTGCSSEVSYQVLVHPKPIAAFNNSPLDPVENLDEVIFNNTSEGIEQIKWNWFFTDNKGYKANTQHASYLYQNPGSYKVAMIVSNKWSCADTIVKNIEVKPDFSIYVPNVFTPNGDGLNDVFFPVVRSSKLFEIKIYDRWGTEVFHSKTPQDGWDGSYRAEMCKQDVYVWKIRLSTIHGEAKEYTGTVTLLPEN